MKEFELSGKVAIVTGSAGLIGKEFCIALAEAGATVIAADLRTNKKMEWIQEYPSKIYPEEFNITRKKSVENACKRILKDFGKIDILVNNAAINDMVEDPKALLEQSKFEYYPLETWNKSIETNITGTFLCCQIFGQKMAEQQSGSIINISSTYGISAPDQRLYKSDKGEQLFFKPPAYSVSKGAILMLTRYLASYWGEKGIRVNTLTPGGVENSQDAFFIHNYSMKTPLGRMASPKDYKGAIVFLASEASSYMTGSNLIIDGGWTCW